MRSGIQSPVDERIRRLVAANHRLKVPQGRTGALAAGVAADNAAALFPAALVFDLMGGRAVMSHAPCHARPPAVPLKNSQPVKPAALAITSTRRAICDSDSPNTFALLSTPVGLMASWAPMATG